MAKKDSNEKAPVERKADEEGNPALRRDARTPKKYDSIAFLYDFA